MNDKDIDAFPTGAWEYDGQGKVLPYQEKGMTLRDYFAAKAMQSILDGSWPDLQLIPQSKLSPVENSAVFAYQIADAMLEARKS